MPGPASRRACSAVRIDPRDRRGLTLRAPGTAASAGEGCERRRAPSGSGREREVGDRALAGEALEAAHEVRADLVLLRVDRLEADLHLGRDLVGLHAALVVQLDERAVLVGEVREQRV